MTMKIVILWNYGDHNILLWHDGFILGSLLWLLTIWEGTWSDMWGGGDIWPSIALGEKVIDELRENIRGERVTDEGK